MTALVNLQHSDLVFRDCYTTMRSGIYVWRVGSRIVYITEKLAHQHVQNAGFVLFDAARLFRLTGLISYPLVLIYLRSQTKLYDRWWICPVTGRSDVVTECSCLSASR